MQGVLVEHVVELLERDQNISLPLLLQAGFSPPAAPTRGSRSRGLNDAFVDGGLDDRAVFVE